jgi:hypothetical protein
MHLLDDKKQLNQTLAEYIIEQETVLIATIGFYRHPGPTSTIGGY